MKSSSDISFQPSTNNSLRVEMDISHIRESTKPSSTMFMSVISFLSMRLKKAVLSFCFVLNKSFSHRAVVLLPHSPLTEELHSFHLISTTGVVYHRLVPKSSFLPFYFLESAILIFPSNLLHLLYSTSKPRAILSL